MADNLDTPGWQHQFGHVWLTISTRQQIAAKLQQGISNEKNLDGTKESVGLEFHREHLVGKRDLSDTEKHSNYTIFSGAQMIKMCSVLDPRMGGKWR